MKSKRVKVALGFLVVLVIVFGAGYYFLFYSGVTKAQLYVESGDVFVNDVIGYSFMKLSEGDVIETGVDGSATVILYDSVVINLEGGTRVSLDDLTRDNPEVSQERGETWNTFTKLSGVESYTIKNGETIASVRATSFGFKDGYILGGEGEVFYFAGGREFSVLSKEVIEKVDDIFIKRSATSEEIVKIKVQMEKTVRGLQELREGFFRDSPLLVSLIKKQTGFNKEELRGYMERIDEGEIDLDELVGKSPVKTTDIKKIEEVTRAILKIKAEIRSLDG